MTQLIGYDTDFGYASTNAAPSLSEPTGTAEGDLLIYTFAVNESPLSSAYAPPTGWSTLVEMDPSNSPPRYSVGVYYIWRGSSAPSYSFDAFSGSWDEWHASVTAWRGVDSTTPFDGVTPWEKTDLSAYGIHTWSSPGNTDDAVMVVVSSATTAGALAAANDVVSDTTLGYYDESLIPLWGDDDFGGIFAFRMPSGESPRFYMGTYASAVGFFLRDAGGHYITHVGDTTTYDSDGGTVTFTEPSGVQAGDLLLLHVYIENGSVQTAPSGWTLAASDGPYTSNYTYLYWVERGSSAPALTFNAGTVGVGVRVSCSAWRGVDFTNGPFVSTPSTLVDSASVAGLGFTAPNVDGAVAAWGGSWAVYDAATAVSAQLTNDTAPYWYGSMGYLPPVSWSEQQIGSDYLGGVLNYARWVEGETTTSPEAEMGRNGTNAYGMFVAVLYPLQSFQQTFTPTYVSTSTTVDTPGQAQQMHVAAIGTYNIWSDPTVVEEGNLPAEPVMTTTSVPAPTVAFGSITVVATPAITSTLLPGPQPVFVAEAPPPSIPWQTLLASAVWLTAINARQRTTACRVDLVDDSGEVVASFGTDSSEGGIVSGSVTCDSSRHVRWSCSLTLSEPGIVPTSATDLLGPLSRLLARVWWLIRLPDGTWGEVPVGTYTLSAPQISDSATSFGIRVDGDDPVGQIKRAKWSQEVYDLGGEQVDVALAAVIADRAPWVRQRITSVSDTLPSTFVVGEPGRDPWDDVQRIARAGNLDVYADRLGTIVGVPDRTKTAVEDYGWVEGANCTVTQVGRKVSTDTLLNRYTVASSNTELEVPVSATVQDDDPSSPTWIGHGRIWSGYYAGDQFTTVEQCEAFAKSVLARRRALIERVELTARARPDVDPGDLVSVHRDRSAVAGIYEVEALALSLGPGSAMKVGLSERREQW